MHVSERLAGKVIVIAGGGAGTGAASARRYAAEGAHVVIGDNRLDAATAVADSIKQAGGEASPRTFDMLDYASIEHLIDFAATTYGRLDGLHNIAGNPGAQATDGDVMTIPDETWNLQLQSHLLSYAHIIRTAIPVMLRAGGGSIINTSSGASRGADVIRIGYQTAKAGIETLTRHVAHRFGKEGVRCNTICYGLILTETAKAHLPQHFQDQALSRTWSPRLGKPEDAAALAAFLMADESEWLNGQIIDLNGGSLLGP